MDIGVLGGTFDPVHNGHLAMAGEARKRLKLDEVIFVPAGQPQLRGERPITPAEHRVRMLRLALTGKPHFKLSTIEIERPGPSYTINTIAGLRDSLGEGYELYFILGWDSLAKLPEWHEPLRLIHMCHLVVEPRPGYFLPDLKAMEALVPGISRRVTLLDKPLVDISATGIRDRVARGLPVGRLVPAPVNRYIKEHGLYVDNRAEH